MTDSSSKERLAAIREREQKATKGPWVRMITDSGYVLAKMDHYHTPRQITSNDDLYFAQKAREDIPFLLSLVESQSTLLTECREAVEHETLALAGELGRARIAGDAIREATIALAARKLKEALANFPPQL